MVTSENSKIDSIKLQTKTVDLLIDSIEKDIGILKIFERNKWIKGIRVYNNKIDQMFSGLVDLLIILGKANNELKTIIDILKNNSTSLEFTHRLEKYKIVFKQSIKSLELEQSLYSCGFKEYEDKNDIKIKSIRRNNEGELKIVELP